MMRLVFLLYFVCIVSLSSVSATFLSCQTLFESCNAFKPCCDTFLGKPLVCTDIGVLGLSYCKYLKEQSPTTTEVPSTTTTVPATTTTTTTSAPATTADVGSCLFRECSEASPCCSANPNCLPRLDQQPGLICY